MTLRAAVNANADVRNREPWFIDLPEEVRQRVWIQDLERLDAADAVDREASADRYSPANQRFVAVCCNQARENINAYAKHNHAAWNAEPKPLTPDALDQIRQELGIQPAVEQLPNAAD